MDSKLFHLSDTTRGRNGADLPCLHCGKFCLRAANKRMIQAGIVSGTVNSHMKLPQQTFCGPSWSLVFGHFPSVCP